MICSAIAISVFGLGFIRNSDDKSNADLVQAAKVTQQPAKETIQKFKLDKGKSWDDNPLKGFLGFVGTAGYTDFPSSMEYILVPISLLVVGKDKYDWSWFESELAEVTAYGRQAVVSFYLDYPGTGKTAIPQYLIDDGLITYPYDKYGGGLSPDYTNRDLWDMMFKFVRAFANRYDGDARIAEIEASIAGIWGEWHTHPYTTFGLLEEDLLQLAKVYDECYEYTQVAYRYPIKGMEQIRGGYSDYSFCYQTIVDEWSQLNRLEEVGVLDVWKRYMCGGELIPQYRDEIFETKDWCLREGESYQECLDVLHTSWLLVGNLASFTMGEREQAIKAANMLGYEFYIESVSYDPYIEGTIKNMTLSVNIKNIGCAPIYYDWPVTIELLNNYGNVMVEHTTDWDIRQIAADGKSYTFTTTIPLTSLKKGIYTIALRVKNPLSNGNPIRFSNETQHRDGLMMLGQLGYRTTSKFTKSLVEEDTNQMLIDQYGWGISSSYLRDQITCGDTYVFGVRFRKYLTDKPLIDYDMKIYLYKDGKYIKTIKTTWNLKNVKGDTVYLGWPSNDLEPGEYVMKLKVARDVTSTDIGHLVVKERVQ